VLARRRGRGHSRRGGHRSGRTAARGRVGGRVVVAVQAVFALVAAVVVVVLQERQSLALVLGLGRPFEHGEYLAEQLTVLGRLPEPALHGAGVVVDAEPAVVAVRYGAQERSREERLGLRALVARLVRETGRRRRLRLGILGPAHHGSRRGPSLAVGRRTAVVAAVVAVRRVPVERRELSGHLQLLLQRYAAAVLVARVVVVGVGRRRHHRRERVVLLLDLQQRFVFVHQYPVRVVLRIVFTQRLLRRRQKTISGKNTL